jgi:multidrug efflux pump subunit AcrB
LIIWGKAANEKENNRGGIGLMYRNLKSGSLKIGTLLVILSLLFALIISVNGYTGIKIWIFPTSD